MGWGWVLAAQGLTLILVSIGMIIGAIFNLLSGPEDVLKSWLFLLFFVGALLGGVYMTYRNWPRHE